MKRNVACDIWPAYIRPLSALLGMTSLDLSIGEMETDA
jgi:hypothetical protein